jgi:hypothetical protein
MDARSQPWTGNNPKNRQFNQLQCSGPAERGDEVGSRTAVCRVVRTES